MKIRTSTVFPLVAFFVAAVMLSIPQAFAEDNGVTITTASGNLSTPGCEETAEGCYTPENVTVDVGTVITMINTDSAGIHTFTAGTVDGFTPTPTGEFDSGILNADDSFTYTADTEGEIPYYCVLHTWMQGTITIQAAGASSDNDDAAMMDESSMSMEMDLDQIMAKITTSDAAMNEPMTIDLTMTDLEGNGIQHITYNIKATQDTKVILDEEGHMHLGVVTNSHVTSALPLDASDTVPVIITVESVGFGHDDQYVAVTGEITTLQVVPEFGTIAVMILAVAIVSIVAISSKSRLSIMPRL